MALAGYYNRFNEEFFVGKIESMYGLRKLAYELVVPWPFMKTAGRMT